MEFQKRINTALDLALWRKSMSDVMKTYPRDKVPLTVYRQFSEARLIWLSKDMHTIAYETSLTLSGITEFEILDYLPSKSGVIYFAGGMPVENDNGMVYGLVWRIDEAGIFYLDLISSLDYYLRETSNGTHSTTTDSYVLKKYKDAPILFNFLIQPMGRLNNGMLHSQTQISPMLLACLLLMREGGVSNIAHIGVKRPPLTKNGKGFKDIVSVINVGNIKYVASKEHNGNKLNVRFVVGGHFRNQFYPKTNEHKRIFINPFIKGPPGAPLKQSRPVYKY